MFRKRDGGNLEHLTIQDMAFAGVKNHGTNEFLPGYYIKKWNELNKPLSYNMSKYKGGGMLETVLR
jgi:hypothetical protein